MYIYTHIITYINYIYVHIFIYYIISYGDFPVHKKKKTFEPWRFFGPGSIGFNLDSTKGSSTNEAISGENFSLPRLSDSTRDLSTVDFWVEVPWGFASIRSRLKSPNQSKLQTERCFCWNIRGAHHANSSETFHSISYI